MLVGYFHLQIVGVCLGFLAGRLLLSFAYPWQVGRLLKVTMGSQLRSCIRPALVTTALFACAAGIADEFFASSWLTLFVAIGLTVLAVSVASFYTGISTAQRACLIHRVRVAVNHRNINPTL